MPALAIAFVPEPTEVQVGQEVQVFGQRANLSLSRDSGTVSYSHAHVCADMFEELFRRRTLTDGRAGQSARAFSRSMNCCLNELWGETQVVPMPCEHLFSFPRWKAHNELACNPVCLCRLKPLLTRGAAREQ